MFGMIERNGHLYARDPVGELPSKKNKAIKTIALAVGVATTALGAIAIIAFFISPHSKALMWIEIGPYSFALLGGGALITLISSIFLYKLNKQEKLYLNSQPMATEASWGRSVSYEIKGERDEGNLDVSYADPTKGWGIVLDGVGHNHPGRAPEINKTFDQLVNTYQPITRASSLEEARTEIMNQLKLFTKVEYSSIAASAVSFCQIVEIDGSKHLLLFQWADTRVLIQKKDGKLDWLDEFYREGIGEAGFGFNSKFGSCLVEKGDIIIGFSDGIGEYMSKKMFTDVLQDTNSLNHETNMSIQSFLHKLEVKIQGNEDYVGDAPITGRKLKSFNEKKGDDLSFFCLKI